MSCSGRCLRVSKWGTQVARYRRGLETLVVRIAFGGFGSLPLDSASGLGASIGRAIGPRLGVSARARRNLELAFPDKPPAEITDIIRGMWAHLGRMAGEYPHLSEFDCYGAGGRVEVVGTENIDALRDDGIGTILFSAHLGNWEIASLGATQRGLPVHQIYRAANNAAVGRLIMKARAPVGDAHYAKGRQGAREMAAALARGEHLAMLVDQKLNEGIAVPFFGRDAMTAPALATLALRHRCPVVPVRVERLNGANFRLTFYAPLALPDSGDRKADRGALMAQVNIIIEGWIRERPEQWLWLHRRWPGSG